jgi:glucose/arabinose dehydrogenase
MAYRAGDRALYIVTKTGVVWAIRDGRVDPTPALDLSGQVSGDSEQGLLGLAFSPSGAFGYVDYTDLEGDTNVVEYAWKHGRADLATKRLVLFVHQPFPNHNGGNLVFGPDGHLYIGLGDGGGAGDPMDNAQKVSSLLGKLLRIDPRPTGGRAHGIPSDNPFVGRAGARPEIWAYGLRNPWRSSFDPQTGDLWIGDVGWGTREDVDFQAAGSGGGQNYGWSRLEGTHVVEGPAPPDAVPPAYEYRRLALVGSCAIRGGYVYRGTAMPDLEGWYLFGDFCLGDLIALRFVDGQPNVGPLGAHVPMLSSFGQDQQGELYALSLTGGVYKLVP